MVMVIMVSKIVIMLASMKMTLKLMVLFIVKKMIVSFIKVIGEKILIMVRACWIDLMGRSMKGNSILGLFMVKENWFIWTVTYMKVISKIIKDKDSVNILETTVIFMKDNLVIIYSMERGNIIGQRERFLKGISLMVRWQRVKWIFKSE